MALVLLKLLGAFAILGVAVAIIGGEDVKSITEFPYFIAVIDEGETTCGGSLIRLDVVLTAAHCIHDVDKKNLKIRAGALYRIDNGKDVKTLPVDRKIVHENYNSDNHDNDIAILKTKGKFVTSSLIDTIDLPAAGANYDFKVGTVLGWGDTENGDATVLQKATLAILGYTTCLKLHDSDNLFTTNICMFDTTKPPAKALCDGDSGGPVAIHFQTKRDVIAGVISWTYEENDKCSAKFPSVGMNVENYLNWINGYLNQFDASGNANNQKPDSSTKPQNNKPGSSTKPPNNRPRSPTRPQNNRPGSPTKPQNIRPATKPQNNRPVSPTKPHNSRPGSTIKPQKVKPSKKTKTK